MRRLRILLLAALIFVLFISGCTVTPEITNDPADDLPFPGLKWGITPAELCSALSLSDGDYVEITYETASRQTVGDVYMNVFDAKAQISFTFFDLNSDGEYCLYDIMLCYPAQTDMNAVKASVVRQYGEPAEQTDANTIWKSKALIEDYMSEEDKAMSGQHGEWAFRMMQNPVTTVVLTDCYKYPAVYDKNETTNVLTFSSEASLYIREGGYAVQYPEE